MAAYLIDLMHDKNAAVRRMCDATLEVVAEAGRDPASLEIVPFGSTPDPGKLDHFEAIGVTECVFRLPAADRDTVLTTLDDQARLIGERR